MIANILRNSVFVSALEEAQARHLVQVRVLFVQNHSQLLLTNTI